MNFTKDRAGLRVAVGDRVKVLSVDESLIRSLRDEELELVNSMIGDVLTVTKICDFGYATVEKQTDFGDGRRLSQAVSLSPEEMTKEVTTGISSGRAVGP